MEAVKKGNSRRQVKGKGALKGTVLKCLSYVYIWRIKNEIIISKIKNTYFLQIPHKILWCGLISCQWKKEADALEWKMNNRDILRRRKPQFVDKNSHYVRTCLKRKRSIFNLKIVH